MCEEPNVDAAEPPAIVVESGPADHDSAESAPRGAPEPRPFQTSPPLPISPPEEPGETGDEDTKLELGVGTFLLAGAVPAGFVGVSPFLVANVGQDVFFRPSIALGKPVSTATSATWAAARVDTCARISGLYARGKGIELDVCGGADVGFSYVGSGSQAGAPLASITQPYVDIGPSVALRSEIGRLVISVRAAGSLNVAHQGFDDATGVPVDSSPVSLRIELDFSWRMPGRHASSPEPRSAASL
jgi:hypothetical protein